MGADFTLLEWKPPLENGGAKVTNYHIFKRESEDDEPQKLKTVSSHELSCEIKSLRQVVTYYFSICAENKAGLSKFCHADHAVCPMKPLGK